MKFEVNNKTIETDAQGYLHNLDDWSEEFSAELAKQDSVTLYDDHWELIWYFRDYFEEEQRSPTMHTMVRSLGKMKGSNFHAQKEYEKHIYKLFPSDPVHEICKLAGLPMPPPDT